MKLFSYSFSLGRLFEGKQTCVRGKGEGKKGTQPEIGKLKKKVVDRVVNGQRWMCRPGYFSHLALSLSAVCRAVQRADVKKENCLRAASTYGPWSLTTLVSTAVVFNHNRRLCH